MHKMDLIAQSKGVWKLKATIQDRPPQSLCLVFNVVSVNWQVELNTLGRRNKAIIRIIIHIRSGIIIWRNES